MDRLAKVLHNPSMQETELRFLHGARMPRCQARVSKRFDDYFTLQLMTRGAVRLAYDEVAYDLADAWAWTAFPGPHIRFGPASAVGWWTHRYAAFRGPLVRRWQAEGLWPDAPQPIDRPRRLARRFDELLVQMHRPGVWARRRAVNLLEGILLALAEARRSRPVLPAELREAMRRIEAATDAGRSLDYAGLAADLGVSLTTLRRRFREQCGRPLHAYALEVRIARARRLLGQTDAPIKAVAEQLGYCDVYYFTRQFRQQTGVTPAAYRRTRQV